MTQRRFGLGLLALSLLVGCHEYRPISPFALPAVSDMSNRVGGAQAIDLQNEVFQIDRGFDVQVEPLDNRREPAVVEGPIAASVERGALWIRGKDDALPRRFELGAMKDIGVRRVSPGKTIAVVFGVTGGVASALTTTVLILAMAAQPHFAPATRSNL